MAESLTVGMRLHAQFTDGNFYPAEVVAISQNRRRAKAPIKVSFVGFDAQSDSWVSLDNLKSKLLRRRARRQQATGTGNVNAPADYSGLQQGMRVQAEGGDGIYYAADVVNVSTARVRAKAPVKVHFCGYTNANDEWVGADRLRSKALRLGAKVPAQIAAKPAQPGQRRPPLRRVPQFAVMPTARKRRRRLVSEGGPIVQMLVGDAIGDAFGLGIEMQDAFWIRKNVKHPPEKWPDSSVAPNGAPVTTRGMYSDDCEMTVGLMNGLMSKGKSLDSVGMLQAWKDEWELDGRRRAGHGSIRHVWTGEQTLEDVQKMQANKENPGNAPPMRSMPLLFFDTEDMERLCIANADATHPHPKARAASFAIAYGARWLVHLRGDRTDVLAQVLQRLRKSGVSDASTQAYLEEVDALPDWHSYGARFETMPESVHATLCGPQPNPDLASVKCGDPPGVLGVHGLGSDAMRTAGVVLYIVKWAKPAAPLEALIAAVDVGGDVDSTAALVLAIIGASSGLCLGQEGGLPWFMVEELEGVEYLVDRATAFEAWLKSNDLYGKSV